VKHDLIEPWLKNAETKPRRRLAGWSAAGHRRAR
jgi:hypothetical protein